MNNRACVLVATTGLLAGCLTGPDYARQEPTTPEHWASPLAGGESDEQAVLTQWWRTFEDPLLSDLIQRALESNQDLRIAEARVREARAARGVVASSLLPILGASGSYSRNQGPEMDLEGGGSPISLGASVGPLGLSRSITYRGRSFAVTQSATRGVAGGTTSVSVTPGGAGNAPDRQTDLYQAGFDASWEIDVFGGNRRGVEAAEADIEAAAEFHNALRVSLLAELAINYIELRGAQSRLAITRKNIDAQADSVELTQARYEAGLTSELDAIRAQALLSSTRSQVPLLETAVSAAAHRLSVLLGEPPGALLERLRSPKALPTPPEQLPVGLPSQLLQRRPDIRQSERELAAATARVGQAMAGWFPRFFLTGAFGGASDAVGSLLSGSNQIWSFGPAITLPIFQGGRVRANVEVQRARVEQARIGFEQSVLIALEEVENGLVSFANEQDRRRLLEEAVAANQNAVRIANERYVNGLVDYLNVLQAQQQLFQSEDLLVQSEQFILTDLILLYKALGGGWEATPETVDKSAIPAL